MIWIVSAPSLGSVTFGHFMAKDGNTQGAAAAAGLTQTHCSES